MYYLSMKSHPLLPSTDMLCLDLTYTNKNPLNNLLSIYTLRVYRMSPATKRGKPFCVGGWNWTGPIVTLFLW